MSSSLLKRFEASRESAPVESPLDKPASIHDDAGKVVAAVEPAVPATAESSSGPGLHAPGLPAEPVTKPVDATGVAKDESADKNVVAAVKPAVPSSNTASGLPAEPVKEAKSNAAAVADDKADAEGKTVAAVQSVTPHHANEALAIVMEARTAAALEWMMEDKHGVQISVPVRSQAHHGHLADYFDKLANDPAEKAKKNHDGIPGIHSEADMHRSMADYHRKLSKGIDPANEDLDPGAAQVQPATFIVPMPDHARETEAAYRAVEEAALSHAAEELDRVQSGLEGLRDRIDAANATGGLSAESAFFASFAVESLLKRFEIEDKAIVSSFESAVVVPDGKSIVSTDALNAALEGVDNGARHFWQRTYSAVSRTFSPLYTRIKLNARDLAAIASEARRVKGTSGKSISVPKAYVAKDGKTVDNVAGAFEEAAEKLHYLVADFAKQAAADFKDNIKSLEEAAKSVPTRAFAHWRDHWNEEGTQLLEKIWSHWKDPRVKLGGNPSDPIVGDYVFFEDQHDKYGGDIAVAKKFDAFANKAYPVPGSYQIRKHAESKGSVDIKPLTAEQITRIAARLQDACKGVGALRSLMEHLSLIGLPFAFHRFKSDSTTERQGYHTRTYEYATASNGHMATTVHEKADHEFMAVEDALRTSQRLAIHVGYDATRALIGTIKHFIKIAKLSLNAHAKASVEAFDQQNSLDGVSVNETAPNEPVQMPAEGHTATEKELMAKQDSWEDQPASFQTIEDEACCESLIAEGRDLQVVTKHYAMEAEGAEGGEKASILKRSEATVKKWMTKVLEYFRAMWTKIQSYFGRGSKRFQELYQRARRLTSAEIQFTISEDEAKWVQNFKMPDFDKFINWMNEVGELASNSINGRASSDPMLTKAAGSSVVPAAGLPGAFTVKADGISFTTVEEPMGNTSWDERVHQMHKVELEDFLKKAAGTAERIEKISDVQLRELNRRKDAMEDIDGSNAFVQHLVTTLVSFGSFMLKGVSIVHRWENEVIRVIDRALDRDPKKGTAATEDFEAPAIDFDGAVNACESLMDEAGEIAILSQHYATEAEASGEAKPHPGMVERIKAWVAKIGEFFRSVWKRIVAFVTQQGNRLMDWASRLRKHHFEKVTVKITGAQDAYINDMKLPNLSPFYEFMDEAAGAGETLATKLEAFNASGGYQGTSDGKTLDHRAKAIDANAAFMNIHTDTPIPAEGLVGAFKLSIEDGKLVETQVVKKIGEDREYTVTGSSLASFVEGAARLIKKAEARAKAFEMKSDADWKKAKVAADTLVSSNGGLFNLKLYGESARFLMKAFSVLQSWARAVGNFAEECIKGAGSKLHKSDRDDIVDAKFTPAAEARADLPYWYHPAEA